jgi:hypothetical protein
MRARHRGSQRGAPPANERIQRRNADQRAVKHDLEHAVLVNGDLDHGAHHENSTAATNIQSALIGRILESQAPEERRGKQRRSSRIRSLRPRQLRCRWPAAHHSRWSRLDELTR